MLIFGAKGFAKEVLEICHQCEDLKNLVFYDDINLDIGTHLFNQFKILKNIKEAKHYFETVDCRFTIGIGNPELREKIYKKFMLTTFFMKNRKSQHYAVNSKITLF